MSNPEAASEASRSSDCPACPGKPVLEHLPSRVSELGLGMTVRRALPNRQRRMVGAWCFLDHAGPADYTPGGGMQVGPHPHIGLQTFTWMIEGEILHKDSLGYEQPIRPGQVNLMTAGRGIAHAEISAQPAGRVHAAQLWIALPDAERRREPSFHHYPELPVLESGGFTITVLAGTAFGKAAPAMVFSPLVAVDLAASSPAQLAVPLNPAFEHGAMVLTGTVEVEGERLEPGSLLYLGSARQAVKVRCDAAARLLLIGGEPFKEEVLLWWNFVARSPEEMVEATEQWNGRRHFGEVPGVTLPRLVAPDIKGLSLRRPAK